MVTPGRIIAPVAIHARSLNYHGPRVHAPQFIAQVVAASEDGDAPVDDRVLADADAVMQGQFRTAADEHATPDISNACLPSMQQGSMMAMGPTVAPRRSSEPRRKISASSDGNVSARFAHTTISVSRTAAAFRDSARAGRASATSPEGMAIMRWEIASITSSSSSRTATTASMPKRAGNSAMMTMTASATSRYQKESRTCVLVAASSTCSTCHAHPASAAPGRWRAAAHPSRSCRGTTARVALARRNTWPRKSRRSPAMKSGMTCDTGSRALRDRRRRKCATSPATPSD